MDPLISGLLGALIGAGASVATVWIQSRSQAKRDRLRFVLELALEDYKSKFEAGKAIGQPFNLPPVTLFLHYHLELTKLLEHGTLTAVDLERLTRQNRELSDTIDRLQDERSHRSKSTDA